MFRWNLRQVDTPWPAVNYFVVFEMKSNLKQASWMWTQETAAH